MNCTLALRMLDAHVDRELDAATAAEVNEHLAACGGCRAAHDRRVALHAALGAAALRHPVPADLRPSIVGAIAEPDRHPATARPLRWWHALAFSATAAVAGAIGGWWIGQPQLAESLPEVVVARHVASLSPAGPRIDIASSDRHVVRPWFQGRLDFAPLVRDLSAQGFDLVGGRVERLEARPAVAVVYRLHGHVISVFSWRVLPGRPLPEVETTIRGFNVATWHERDMSYAAVSDTDAAELRRFTLAYRSP